MDNISACLGFSRKDPIPESTEAVVTMSLSGYGSYNFRFFNLWLSLGVWALKMCFSEFLGFRTHFFLFYISQYSD